MADQNPVWVDTFKASASLVGKQGFFVELTATGDREVALVNAATDQALGIAMDEPSVAGRPVVVGIIGEFLVVSDGSGVAIAPGDLIGTNASGKAVKKATADFSTRGIALDASAADGTKIRALLFAPGYFRTAAG